MRRDTVWHELHDLMLEGSCPICALVSKRLISYMESILYEGINDPMIRKKLCEADGLCNTHAYQLLAKGDPLAHAIIYLDIIDNPMRKMEAAPNSISIRHDKCLFCESVQHSESTYVRHFAESISDEPFKKRYQEAGILCVHHYFTVVKLLKESNSAKFLMEATQEIYQGLIENLKEIRQKNDYRYSEEPWSPGARVAWKKAVSVINGFDGMKEDNINGK